MLLLGSQYYRPPTPCAPVWEPDILKMKEAGLNTVQLWAVWGWIEPEPEQFVYDDYDRLLDLCDKHGMSVVISTITDLQPFWVPRFHPNAYMVDDQGNKIIGTPRQECLSGMTPGYCTDHADIRDLSVRFMRELAAHCKDAPALLGWDCWNETRWCVHCGRWVCYCDASLEAFRAYLKKKYETLEALGEAWGRRAASWEDVRPAQPASMICPPRMDWGRWLVERARDMAAWRYSALREGDPNHPIAAHAPTSVARDRRADEEEAPMARGNDFDNAAEVDIFGTSTFPAWWESDPADVGVLLEVTRSVSQPKPYWLSELQGGAFNQAFEYGLPVSGDLQQFWTWSAYARGAQGVIYWCWNDEVWGIESGGYGIAGQDGMAEDRARALQETSRILTQHDAELSAYQPDSATVGVVFDADTVLLSLASRAKDASVSTYSTNGSLKALEKLRLPYDLLDGRHLHIPENIKLIVLPAAFCLNAEAATVVESFMESGGRVFCEAGTGMYDERGFYHARAEDRPLVGGLGLGQYRRRNSRLDASCTVAPHALANHAPIALQGALWSVALDGGDRGHVLAEDETGDALLVEVPVGEGSLVMSGTFPAHAYYTGRYSGFEELLHVLALRAGAYPQWKISSEAGLDGISVRTGTAGNKRLCFILNGSTPRQLNVEPDRTVKQAREWVTGSLVQIGESGALQMDVPGPGYRILEWDNA